MYKGHIDYVTEIDGVAFDPFEIGHKHSLVEKVRIEAMDGKLKIRFFVLNVTSCDEAYQLTQSMVDGILDKLSFILGVPIHSARYSGGSIEREVVAENGSKSVEVQGTGVIGLMVSALLIRKLSPELVENLRRNMEREDIPGTEYLNQFRFALQSPDPVTRFMFLYSILLAIFDDSQKEVDDFIREVEPTVSVTPRPDRPDIYETIYTRLRNEVGHHRPNVNPANTKKEMARLLPKLIDLVRKAIKQASL